MSEHACSAARGRQINTSLRNLAREVRKDVGLGLYALPRYRRLHTFVTLARVTVHLKDGYRSQWFPCRVDEVEDYRGRRSFEASCPTNYLHESGKTIKEAMNRLGDVIEARYKGEGLHDLMREIPKCPILATIDVSPDQQSRWGTAVITPGQGSYTASIPGSQVEASSRDPYQALLNAEQKLAGQGTTIAPLSDEPVFCVADVPLALFDGTHLHRFLISISFHENDGSSFYVARAPQAGDLSIQSQSFDDALAGIRDAIALECREKTLAEITEMLKVPPFLATVRLPRT
ncbi:hypothetical protein [Methanocella arvoryzae]|uniref:hypothetical protein n=1 Tax=Methanocella arvoryzae TaxID=1175445 RepID=UPI0011D1A3EE|nr:hypothetical protein [Methanocella arvoryzae]